MIESKYKTRQFRDLGIREGNTYKMDYSIKLQDKDKILPEKIIVNKIYPHHLTYTHSERKNNTYIGSITKVDLLVGDYVLTPTE